MGYDVRWANEEKTIALCELIGDWEWDDFYQMSKSQVELVSTVDHLVHLIIFEKNEDISLPPGALNHIKQLINMSHANVDRVVIVNIPPVVRTLLNMLKKIPAFQDRIEKYMFADTLEDAYTALEEYEKNKG